MSQTSLVLTEGCINMLKKLAYLGHELTNSNFSLDREPKSKGYYRYSVNVDDMFCFNEVNNEKEEHIHNEISISIASSIHGFEKESDEPVFTLDIKFVIRFEINKDEYIEEKFALDNNWFFMNFAHIASKDIIDSILSHSPLKGTFIPAHRLGDD